MKSLIHTAVIVGIMLAATSARADTLCTSGLFNVVIDGNLVVPDGANCTFVAEVTVTGNVLVGSGATFLVQGGPATISGNVLADHCAVVEIVSLNHPVSVGGNIEIQHCTSQINIFTVRITGNLHVHNNSTAPTILHDSVGGNANVSNNTGVSEVAGTTIGGNLQCVGNDSIDNEGNPNSVAGTELGQCAGL